MKHVKQIAIAAALAASALGVVQAQSYFDVNFNDTHKVGPDSVSFKGSFTYGGVVYGPNTAVAGGGATAPTANSINLSAFDADTLYISGNINKLGNNNTYLQKDGSTGGSVVYRVYRQAYSGVVGNLTKGTQNEAEDRIHFVKAVVGQGTNFNSLPSSGTYIYEGVAFSNFPEGDFIYTVNLANKTGSGEFDLSGLKVPGSIASLYNTQLGTNYQTGTNYALDVEGTLNTGTITADANGIANVSGTVTASAAPGQDQNLYEVITLDSSYTVNPNYYLTFFGTNSGTDVAKEVAGAILGLPERIGGVAIIGKR